MRYVRVMKTNLILVVLVCVVAVSCSEEGTLPCGEDPHAFNHEGTVRWDDRFHRYVFSHTPPGSIDSWTTFVPCDPVVLSHDDRETEPIRVRLQGVYFSMYADEKPEQWICCEEVAWLVQVDSHELL